jgi:hypothetical protein
MPKRFVYPSLIPPFCHGIIRRTKEVFWMGFVASWGGQVPAVLLLTRYWRDDLVGLYTGMSIGYFLLTILYSIVVVRRYVYFSLPSPARVMLFNARTLFSHVDLPLVTDFSYHSDWHKYAEMAQLRSESSSSTIKPS